jgi:YD repeat-containing protein
MSTQLWVAAVLFLSLYVPPTSACLGGTQTPLLASKSDRDRAGLRGAVKTCMEERIQLDGREFSTYREYSPDGKLLVWRSLDPDGSEVVRTRTYDADGRIIRTTSEISGVPGTGETLYRYDDAGRMVSITNSENEDRTEFQFQYDEQGRKKEILTFDPKTLRRRQNTGSFSGSAWDGAMLGFGVPPGGSVITIYDENDRPVEVQIRDVEDHLLSRVVGKYNAAGLVVEEKPILENAASALNELPAEEQSQPNTTSFTYDAQGRVTNERESGGAIQSTTATIYNDQGDIAEKRTTVIENNLIPDSDVHYTYQYDSYGNWVGRSATDSSRPDAAPSICRRTLTYY